MVLNADGGSLLNSCKTSLNSCKISFNGLVTNYECSFQFAFYGSVAILNVLHVEIKALLVDIELCWQAGFKKQLCFSNYLHVVQLVTINTDRFHHYVNILKSIRDFLVKDWNIFSHHILHKGSQCA